MNVKTARSVVETALADLRGFIRVGIRLGARPTLRVEISPEADIDAIESALPDLDVPVEIVTTQSKGAIRAH